MKKLITNVLYAGFLTMALLFNACQDEFEEVGNNEQETLEAGSTTADLIVKTTTNDGSFDNIVDEASCIAIQFPYTVEVGGIQITIDSIEDLKLIEEIFDEFDDDEDVLEIIFPITITLADFTEVVIEDKEALRELAAQCQEGGDDDDIECIDFVYPITLFTFDINGLVADSFRINSDRELHLFFDERDDDQLIGIEYPITLKKFDDTEVQVNSNAELARVLEAAKEGCDEDDDDDYNDDDFDDESFVEFLTDCPWEIREFIRGEVNATEQYLEYVLDFDDDGDVEIKDRMGTKVEGDWRVEFTDRGPLLTIEFDTLVDFNLQWLVYEIEEGKIKFYTENGNRIILQRRCDDDDDDDGDDDGDNGIISIETLTNTLKECEWIIEDLEVQDEDIDRLLGYEFIFGENGIVTLGDGITTLEGTWEVGANMDGKRTLFIEITGETAVSLEWPVVGIYGNSILENSEIELKDEASDSEMELQKVCDDNAGDNDVTEIRNIMLGGLWNVTLLDDEGEVKTDDFAGMDFGFSMFNQVEVSVDDDPILAGVWRVLRDTDDDVKFFLNLGENDPFEELTEAWYVSDVGPERIELVYDDEDDDDDVMNKTLVFEKKM